MPIIQWNVNLLVGIQEIDRQHQHLVQSLNRAYDEFREGKEIELSFLQELIDYAAHHFTCEELWMKKTGYPKLESHREEHAHFAGRVADFKKELEGNGRVSVELLWFLCNWVMHHIGETDVDFGRFVDVHKIRAGHQKKGQAGGDA